MNKQPGFIKADWCGSLECEMKINIILADLQKSMGEAIEELVKF